MISEDFLAIAATAALVGFPILAVTMSLRNDRSGSFTNAAEPLSEIPQSSPPPRIATVPRLAAAEWGTAALVLCALFISALFVSAPPGLPADPQITPDPCRAPWFFAGIQEIAVFFHPIIAGTAIPLGVIASLITLPWIRRRRHPPPRPDGQYSLRGCRRTVVLFLVIWSVWFLLIGIGFLLRGEFGT